MTSSLGRVGREWVEWWIVGVGKVWIIFEMLDSFVNDIVARSTGPLPRPQAWDYEASTREIE